MIRAPGDARGARCTACNRKLPWAVSEMEVAQLLLLGCGHAYCRTCLARYVRATLVSKHRGPPLNCCQHAVPSNYVRQVLEAEEILYYEFRSRGGREVELLGGRKEASSAPPASTAQVSPPPTPRPSAPPPEVQEPAETEPAPSTRRSSVRLRDARGRFLKTKRPARQVAGGAGDGSSPTPRQEEDGSPDLTASTPMNGQDSSSSTDDVGRAIGRLAERLVRSPSPPSSVAAVTTSTPGSQQSPTSGTQENDAFAPQPPKKKRAMTTRDQRRRFLLRSSGESSLGFQLEDQGRAWVVAVVEAGSAADRAGLRVGDRCVSYLADRADNTFIAWDYRALEALQQVDPTRCVVVKIQQQQEPEPLHRFRDRFAMKHRKHEEFEEMLVAMYDGNMESYQHGEARLSAPMKLETKVKMKKLQPDMRVQTDDLGQEVIVVDDFEELW